MSESKKQGSQHHSGSDDNINTSGGAYIKGGINNSGGVNVFGGKTGEITYTDNRISAGESAKLDELVTALRSQIAALPAATVDQQQAKAEAEESAKDIEEAVEEVKKDPTKKPKVNLMRGTLSVFKSIGGPVLGTALTLLGQPVLGEAVNGLAKSLPDPTTHE